MLRKGLLAAATISFFVTGGCLAATADCNSPEAVMDKMVSAVKSNDSEAFLSLVDPDGFTMGTDGEELDIAGLRRDFARRVPDGYYCQLFRCGGRNSIVRDEIRLGTPVKTAGTEDSDDMSFVFSKGDIDITIFLRRETCKWYVSTIEYI